MTFKSNWEKADQNHHISSETIHNMVKLALPSKKLLKNEIISGGCANLNIKIILDNGQIFILRVYLRDRASAYREQKLAELIKKNIPIPQIYFIGEYKEQIFAIVEYINGITLREFILNNPNEDIKQVMFEAGKILNKTRQYKFANAGFFDQDLQVIPSSESYLKFTKKNLQHPNIPSNFKIQIGNYLKQYGDFFPKENERNLVHADYDPANILVDEINGIWKITAILDWEFAFSGSTLCDVANMLRYAHQMPKIFTEAFLTGLSDLPKDWELSINLLNLFSLLDCLARCDIDKRPNQYQDICQLIEYILNDRNSSL